MAGGPRDWVGVEVTYWAAGFRAFSQVRVGVVLWGPGRLGRRVPVGLTERASRDAGSAERVQQGVGQVGGQFRVFDDLVGAVVTA